MIVRGDKAQDDSTNSFLLHHSGAFLFLNVILDGAETWFVKRSWLKMTSSNTFVNPKTSQIEFGTELLATELKQIAIQEEIVMKHFVSLLQKLQRNRKALLRAESSTSPAPLRPFVSIGVKVTWIWNTCIFSSQCFFFLFSFCWRNCSGPLSPKSHKLLQLFGYFSHCQQNIMQLSFLNRTEVRFWVPYSEIGGQALVPFSVLWLLGVKYRSEWW